MEFLENYGLKKLTSMYVGGPARFFVEVNSSEELKNALSFAKEKNINHFILGGGSNIIISDKGFDGLVIRINIKGINLSKEDESSKYYEVGAGESWDGFVKFAVENNLYGIENLSHIPGTVGASIVQNIGAYGQEVSSTVASVKVIDTNTLEEKELYREDLIFSYRKSLLNTKEKGRYVVTSVIFKLQKKSDLNIKYDDLKKYFLDGPSLEINLKNLRYAIVAIRNKKFPFPDLPEHGTVGSFWNADVIDESIYNEIIKKLEDGGFKEKALDMKNKKGVFTVSQGFKVPYGVLIEVLGFKGKISGGAKILETHSGVINNFTGLATAKDILILSDSVRDSIKKEFDVNLNIEPELVGDF